MWMEPFQHPEFLNFDSDHGCLKFRRWVVLVDTSSSGWYEGIEASVSEASAWADDMDGESGSVFGRLGRS